MTSANILALIVVYVIGRLIFRGWQQLCSQHNVYRVDNEVAKDLLLKRRDMHEGKNVFEEGDDHFVWLENAKDYLHRTQSR